MSLVKRNVIANLVGGSLLTALTIIITPLQINILGMEAYGVVGFITTLQIAFTAFDLGLSATLTRELAADPTPGKRGSIDLLRTATTVYWAFAALIGILIAASAGQVAHHWFSTRTLDASVLEQSLQVIALYLALRWPVALYVGVLMGLQRMDVLNTVKVATTALRLIGGIAVLVHWRSLHAFLVWTSLNAMVEVLTYWLVCRRVHPSMPARPGMSWQAMRRVWRFSLSMNALAILTVLIVQFDRLLISKLLTLDALGAYSLAYTTASIIPALIAAISSAVLPSFAAAQGQGSMTTLLRRYDGASRLMLYLIGLAVATLAFCGEPLLALWVNPSAASAAAMPLALLAAGFWGSAAVSNAYQVSIATGHPNLALKVSTLTALPYFVLLYGLILEMGVLGAALAWLLLNLAYVVFLLPQVHHRLLGLSVTLYFRKVLVPFALLAFLPFGAAKVLAINTQEVANSPATQIAPFAFAALLYLGLGYLLLGKETQALVHSTFRQRIRLG